MQKGVEVITYRDYLVHLSGHSTSVELQRIMRLLRPRWVIPFHGDYYRHAVMQELGKAAGLEQDAFIPASNGDRIEVDVKYQLDHMDWPVDAYQLGKGKQRNALLLSPEVLEQRRRLRHSGAIAVRSRGRRPVLECIDCPPEVSAWVAAQRGREARALNNLEHLLGRTFVSPPAVVKLG